MLLAIDIGNTNVTVGLFHAGPQGYVPGPVRIWRLATNRTTTADEYGAKLLDLFHYARLDPVQVTGVAVASVVPALDGVFAELARSYFHRNAFLVAPPAVPRLVARYPNPAEIGADRLCDAVAAFALYGGPAIVIDFGTATTFDCIDKGGAYLGGAIAPGPGISAESLAERTAKLPRVDLIRPSRAIGRSTVEGIQSGLYHGYVGLIREIITRVRAEMTGTPVIVATGGLAPLIVPELKEVKSIVPELTLEGIRLIYQSGLRSGHVETVDKPVNNRLRKAGGKK